MIWISGESERSTGKHSCRVKLEVARKAKKTVVGRSDGLARAEQDVEAVRGSYGVEKACQSFAITD